MTLARTTEMLAAASDPPRLDGRFRIEGELARGGMGAVFSAVDRSSGRRVALKRLVANASPRVQALFEREFYVLSSLRHPRIIEVYDYGVDAQGPYYTMELLEGSDLRDLSPAPPATACRYLRDVASSLALLHARRLLHRDVSPRNVRTLPDGGCKLLDFGALTSFGASEDLVGTPPAIPPEALSGDAMDQRSDLFSLGALAYYLLTGRHAYPARKVSDLADVWAAQVVPPSRYAPDIPAELEALVLSLLNLNALARPTSAAEVIHHLNVVGNLPPEREDESARAYFVGAALVERHRELDRVLRRLQRGKSARGDSIFVDAKPGVGKTRFLAKIALKAEVGGTLVLRVDAAAHSGQFSTARALLQQLVRRSPRIAAKVLARHARTVAAVWPELFSELEVRATPEQAPHDGEGRRAELPRALEESLRETAARTPLLVAVDDVDEADVESTALLLALSRAARRERLVVVTTATQRPSGELSAALRALREAGTPLRLRELTKEGVRELVCTAFGDVPHARRTAMRVFTATGGNPGRCMRLLQTLVDEELIRYDGGAWHLPLDIPEEKVDRGERFAAGRLRECSPDARSVAAAVAIRRRPAALEWMLALDEGVRSRREIIAAVEELVRTEVLFERQEGYWFSGPEYVAAALEAVGESTRRALCVRIGEALLAAAETPAARMAAGLHLIQGGQEMRGAELVEMSARLVVGVDPDAARTLSKVSDALEAALDVYRRSGRGNLALVGLLVPLVVASYEISIDFARRYGEETISRLERALGLPASREASETVSMAELLAAMQAAPILEDGEERTETTPDLMLLVGWLISAGITLTAVASTVIDHTAEERFVRALRPFTLFGPAHPAAFVHDFCRLIVGMTEDRFAESHAGFSAILKRLDEVALPEYFRTRLRAGAIYALGVLESQRDDSGALARIRELDSLGETQKVIANQLRFLYHGFRGESDLADRYRDRVEEYAVQHGSAWQVEIWSTCTATAVYGNMRDVAGNKRTVEQLERLKQTAPSLELYWERALACHYLLTGAYDRAVEIEERLLAKSGPRERVGWSAVKGTLARAYNALGRHEDAKRICAETMALASDDFDFVAMTLLVRLEWCRALAGLGETAAAKAYLNELHERYAPNENPATMGAIHRTLVELALAENDMPAFEAHLAQMRRWFLPTNNPALIAQCDQLRNAVRSAGGWGVAQPPTGSFATASQTFVQSVFATCEGEAARKQRALELVAIQAGAREAWLFTVDEGADVVMAGRLGVAEMPNDLLELVHNLFEEATDESEETAFLQDAPFTTAPTNAYRLLPLTVSRGDKRLLVGAIALPMGIAKSVSHDLLQEVATQLFDAGDIATVRTYC